MTVHKDKRLQVLLETLNLDERGWIVIDYWDADNCAIGIANKTSPERLVYLSVFQQPVSHFAFICEQSEATVHEGIAQDLQAIVDVCERFLT